MDVLDPHRARLIEDALVDHVASHPRRRPRRRWRLGVVAVLSILLGAGISTSAFAATGLLRPPAAVFPVGEPRPDLPPVVNAPNGVTPGTPVITLLGEPIGQRFDSDTEISLRDRPAAATHARVTIVPLTAGTLAWGTDPGGNNPIATWDAVDIANQSSWYDFPLDPGVENLYLEPSDFAGAVSIQYVIHTPTALGVNAKGLTYGATGTDQGEPDLIAVEATNGALGYVYAEELADADGTTAVQGFTSPDDALRWQEENAGRVYDLPVYEPDGTTKIGEFRVGG